MITPAPVETGAEFNTAIVMLAGPIKHWWDENWETQEHWDYVDWRDEVSAGLVEGGYLVYHPHNAFKGRWDERAQSVNDLVLRTADVICNLTPPGVPSLGTEGELLFAQNYGDALIVPAPPTADFKLGVANLISRLDRLDIHHQVVEQETVIESLPASVGQEWKVQAAVRHFAGHVLRAHHFDDGGQIKATDAHTVRIRRDRRDAVVHPLEGQRLSIPRPDLLKLEVLQRQVSPTE